MKVFDSSVTDRLAAGEIDYVDALTFIFDSGLVNVFLGRGEFAWEYDVLGPVTFYGLAGLLTIEVPAQTLSNEALPITVRLAETWVPPGSDEPVNVFSDEDRVSIDEEPWQGREVILSRFWRDAGGAVIYREQVGRRVIDAMYVETDEDGFPVRVIVLEREDIVQRDVEGKTANGDFQRLLDPDDRSCEHIAATARQRIHFGAVPPEPAGGK